MKRILSAAAIAAATLSLIAATPAAAEPHVLRISEGVPIEGTLATSADVTRSGGSSGALPSSSVLVQGVIITPPASTFAPVPVLIDVKPEAIMAFQGTNERTNTTCSIVASGNANFRSKRFEARTESYSCRDMVSGQTIVSGILDAWVVDDDAKMGIRGNVITEQNDFVLELPAAGHTVRVVPLKTPAIRGGTVDAATTAAATTKMQKDMNAMNSATQQHVKSLNNKL